MEFHIVPPVEIPEHLFEMKMNNIHALVNIENIFHVLVKIIIMYA